MSSVNSVPKLNVSYTKQAFFFFFKKAEQFFLIIFKLFSKGQVHMTVWKMI